jgi:Zn-dependent peptidase ImmA (M78 family)/DNA-binding XRE family transcriptional regulator
MSMHDTTDSLDPRVLGNRLQDARRARSMTQEAAASELKLKRTTLVAIEKGERRVSAAELIGFARLYGCSVSDLVGRVPVTDPFIAQFRTTFRDVAASDALTGLQQATHRLQEYAERYVHLEGILGLDLARKYPPTYDVEGPMPDRAGEELASAERHRLGLGDGPVTHLRDRLEADVGLRIFTFEMASDVAGVFAYNDALGGCIGINSKHPFPRQRWTLAHEYAHFLSARFAVEVTWLADKRRTSPRERLADSFAQHFLMPASGLNRRFSDVLRARDGSATLADICSLADLYEVSVQALVRALESLNRVPRGLWDRLESEGFRPVQAQSILGLDAHTKVERRFPRRYEMLAVQAHESGELTEGQLAKYLAVERVVARDRAAEIRNRLSSERGDELGSLSLNLRDAVQGR